VPQRNLGDGSDGVVSPTRTFNSTNAHCAVGTRAVAVEKTRGAILLVSYRSIERE
jgi:hypothetical protein